MAEAGARIRAARALALGRIAAAQAGAATAFPAAELVVTGEGPAELAAAWAADRRRDLAAGRTLEGPHRADLEAVYAEKATPAAQCSTGEQKALLISILLGHAALVADRTGRLPLLLLDEAAAHLDPDRRRALFARLAELGGQAWMTGTDAQLFDGLEAVRYGVAQGAILPG